MSTVWEDTNGYAIQYKCNLDIYLMTMSRAINAPDHGNNVVDGINTTEKRYLKEQMELIGKLASNDT